MERRNHIYFKVIFWYISGEAENKITENLKLVDISPLIRTVILPK